MDDVTTLTPGQIAEGLRLAGEEVDAQKIDTWNILNRHGKIARTAKALGAQLKDVGAPLSELEIVPPPEPEIITNHFFRKPRKLTEVLFALAAQENNDGDEGDAMQEAANYIRALIDWATGT